MKRTLLCALVASVLALGPVAATAQTGGEMNHGGRQPMSADQRLQMLSQQLNLTSDQQQQIKPILEKESQSMQSLRQDSSLSQPDRMAKMQEIRQGTAGEITPILNSDQQAKYKEMMSHQQHRGGWQGGEQAPPSGQAPPQ